MIFGIVYDACTAESCQTMSAGEEKGNEMEEGRVMM